MADTFNLTWKLAHVIQGRADPSILRTYHPERGQVAADLIEFDHKVCHLCPPLSRRLRLRRQFSRLFSGKPQKDVFDETGISLVEFRQAFEKGNQFASGTSVDYQSSLLVDKTHGKSELFASKLFVGPRLKSHQVVCLSDARP